MADEKCVRDPRHDCFGLEAAARLEGRIKALEDWQQDSKKFHNSFYDWQREQIARDAKLDEQLSNMDKNIEKLLAKQEEQTAKPDYKKATPPKERRKPVVFVVSVHCDLTRRERYQNSTRLHNGQ